MTPDVQRAIAELSAERRRRHAEVDLDCDRQLEAILRSEPTSQNHLGFSTLKAAAIKLGVSEKTAKRYAIKYNAGSFDSRGHWRINVGLIETSIEAEHRSSAAFAG
jgi:hypothetical protein